MHNVKCKKNKQKDVQKTNVRQISLTFKFESVLLLPSHVI